MTYDIITFGSAVIDAFLEIEDEKIINKKVCFPLGKKILVDELGFATGGGGTNCAVGFSRLGFHVGFLGCFGKDSNSKIILKELKEEKVDFLGKRVNEATGYSVIIDSKNRDRTILTFNGANRDLKLSKDELRHLKAKWFYFSSMNAASFETQKKLAKIAFSQKIPIAYNPSNYITKKGGNYLKDLLRYVSILILNKDEAKDLVKQKDLFQVLHSMGPKMLCITNGEKEGFISIENKEIYSFTPNKVKIAERTGAGDAFACGFLSGFILEKSIPTAIQYGCNNAKSVLGSSGAKKGLLHLKNLKEKIKENCVMIKNLRYH